MQLNITSTKRQTNQYRVLQNGCRERHSIEQAFLLTTQLEGGNRRYDLEPKLVAYALTWSFSHVRRIPMWPRFFVSNRRMYGLGRATLL